MLRTAKGAVKAATKLAGRTVSEAVLQIASLPGADTVPLRRTGFGVSMVLDPRGSTLLEALGDDLDERAENLARFLDRCADNEMNELLSAFQEATMRRAARRTH